MRDRGLFPKRYVGKRLAKKEKNKLFKAFENLFGKKRTFCLALALILLHGDAITEVIPKPSEKEENKDSATINYSLFNKDIIEDVTCGLAENYDFEYNSIVVDDWCYQNEDMLDDLDLTLEIKSLLDKYNMTYSELINLVTRGPFANSKLQDIFTNNPNLTYENIVAILNGQEVNLRETLFIGDSRTKGMIISGVINDDNTVYGIGYGYNWLIGNGSFSTEKTNALNGAINGLNAKMADGKSYNIVIWLGVNDYKGNNAETYFNEFYKLANNEWAKHNIYIVSVGPVKDSKAVYVNNAGINNFNNSLNELITNVGLNNLNYVNLNFDEYSIINYDGSGLHYGQDDYRNIYSIICSDITTIEKEEIDIILKEFYNTLISYCQTISSSNSANNFGLYRRKN